MSMMIGFIGILYFHFCKTCAHNWVSTPFFSFILAADRDNQQLRESSTVRGLKRKKSLCAWRLSLGASVTIVIRDTINRVDSNLSVFDKRG